MQTRLLPLPPGFRVAAAARFFAGFVPGSGMAAAHAGPDELTLAFTLDRTFDSVVAALHEDGDALVVTVAGTDDADAATRQAARILGLDGDAPAWAELGARDGLVGALQREFPGFLTATKPSPYDAAVWAVLAPRLGIARAADLKLAMARALGDVVTLGGRAHAVFPPPARLASLDRFPGVSDEKIARLRGIGAAALDGCLDADRLRALPEATALGELQRLRGVGPWAASHIYHRGAAPHDGLPTAEPRVLRGYADCVGLEVVDEPAFRRAADAWRPFRAWVSVLLARHLASRGLWRAPGLARERAAAGRSLAARTSAVAASS